MTVRSFVSNIQNIIKSENLDSWISPKLIYSKAQEIIGDFLKKDNSGSRLLYKINDAFTEIEGIEMIEVSSTECSLEVYDCQKMMRSKFPLPRLYYSKFGPIITEVMSINMGTTYKNANTPRQWKNIQKREFKGNDRYYFFIGSHIYIPINSASEASPELIRVLGLFMDRWEIAKFKEQNGTCEECNQSKSCKRVLDYELVCPQYLLDNVLSKLVMDLSQSYLKITDDSNPDLNSVDKTGQRQLQDRKLKA